jgi:hypothetical protein
VINLVDRSISLYERLNKIPKRLGVPGSLHTLMIRHSRMNQSNQVTSIDTLIDVTKIGNVSPSLAGYEVAGISGNSITIAQSDWLVSGVPRLIDRDFLINDVQFFAIDCQVARNRPVLDLKGMPVGGKICKLIFLKDDPKKILTWSIVMREIADRSDDGSVPQLF